jgi:hypothetical protein
MGDAAEWPLMSATIPTQGRSFGSSVGISDKMCSFVGIWTVAAVVTSKRERTIATILCTEMRLTDLRLHKSSQLRPTSLPVAKPRLLSRVVRGDPNRPFSEGVRYVELDYLCHNHSPFFSKLPLADVRACNRTAALHGRRFAPMCSAPSLSPLCKANDALESCFRVLWLPLPPALTADGIHIALLHDAANRTHQVHPICRVNGSRFAPVCSAFTFCHRRCQPSKPAFDAYGMFDSGAGVLEWGQLSLNC